MKLYKPRALKWDFTVNYKTKFQPCKPWCWHPCRSSRDMTQHWHDHSGPQGGVVCEFLQMTAKGSDDMTTGVWPKGGNNHIYNEVEWLNDIFVGNRLGWFWLQSGFCWKQAGHLHTSQHLEIRKSGHFHHCYIPPPPLSLSLHHCRPKVLATPSENFLVKSIIPQLVLQSYRQDNYNKIALTYIKSHLYTCTDQINKGNFFSICRKKDLEKYQFTVCLKFKFKNRNIYWLKFEKIGTSRFLEVLKVKSWDCPDKIGTVGRYASTMVYEFSVTLIDCSTNWDKLDD